MKIKNVSELSNISAEVAKVIQEHIDKTGDTPTGFAMKVHVHPLQMLGFLRGERGLNIGTVERIGRKIKESKG
jgi:ArsR family metal-binding transcriptional regulator